MKTKKGFTLIELLVVIAIIGILASVVLASLNSARQKARDARRVADIKQLQLALELYFDSNNKYPIALADLVTGGQIPSEPIDPSNDGTTLCRADHYCYAHYGVDPASPTYYHLGAKLEQNDNLALDSDKDCASSGTSCPAQVIYTAGGFDGTIDATNGVYDVVP